MSVTKTFFPIPSPPGDSLFYHVIQLSLKSSSQRRSKGALTEVAMIVLESNISALSPPLFSSLMYYGERPSSSIPSRRQKGGLQGEEATAAIAHLNGTPQCAHATNTTHTHTPANTGVNEEALDVCGCMRARPRAHT